MLSLDENYVTVDRSLFFWWNKIKLKKFNCRFEILEKYELLTY